MRAVRILFIAVLLTVSASCSNDLEVSSPRVADGLLDLCDSVSIGLEYAPVECIILPSPEGYSNNVLLTGFKGEYYCMWQHSTRDEDSPDTHVLLSTSADARNWSDPEILLRGDEDFFTSPGGWIQRGDSLCAVINRIRSGGRKGGEAWYVTSHGDGVWSTPRRLLMAGGEPLDGIFEQDPFVLPTGRTVGAAHFGETLDVCPLFTDDPSGLIGWRKALLPSGEGKPLEPSRYVSGDGSLVMLFRDQESSFRKLFSVSRDCGESWSAPMMTDIPDSRSKQCAGNLPDGRPFMVWNPSASKSRRHLAIAVSGDGLLFDRAWLIAGPRELPPQRREGRYKTIGYNYPKATVIDGVLWVSLSVNKEDVTLFRIAPDDLLRDYHTEKRLIDDAGPGNIFHENYMKKVLIIAGSPRKDGNSDLLAQQFAKGAAESGNEVEILYLREKKLNYCKGCLVCLKKGECFQKDDANSLLPKMMEADVVCFSCPVYYYSVCGQMKVFLDRMNPLYGKMKDKDFYCMVTAQDDNKTQLDRAFDVFDGFADCFDDIRRCGRIYGGGADKKGEVKDLPAYNEAYELGKSIK